MPEIETHWLVEERTARPVFGRRDYTYYEVDAIEDTKALVEGVVAGRLVQTILQPGVRRVRFEREGSNDRSITQYVTLPPGDDEPAAIDAVGGVTRYGRSHGAQRNSALRLGYATGSGPNLVFESFQLEPDEQLYGLGERNDSVAVRGSRERLWIGDPYVNTTGSMVYLSLPLVWSTAGWGVAVLHGGGVIVEAGNPTSDCLTFAIEGDAIDYIVFEGEGPRDILKLLGATFGFPKMPPDWSLGVWMSRLMYFSRKEVEEMIDALGADGFPFDVFHLDPYWHKSEFLDPAGADRSTLVWNDQDFGPLEEFFDEMKRRKVRISLWESPYFSRNNFAFREAEAEDLLLRNHEGEIAEPAEFTFKAGILDFTNPRAVEWFKIRHRPLLRAGAAVMKSDFGESVPADAVFFDGSKGSEMHNLYPLIYHRTVAEVCREERGDDFVIWARSGFFGSVRDDIPWVGDSVSTWHGMVCALRSVLSMSLSGYPFVSSDIGGFILWDELIGPPAADLFVRWSQWGLLLSHSRFHGVGGREPVLIEEPERSIVREMCFLRMSWLPYIKSLCEEATKTMAPVARPLVYTWPDDMGARQDDLTYTLGDSILVAPVFRADGHRTHYIPEGRWVDHFTGERFEGGRWVTRQCPLERFPLYVKEGFDVPSYDGRAFRAEDALGGG